MERMPKSSQKKQQVVAENRQARFRYEIIDTYEAGLVLKGSEIKALREGKASIAESYAAASKGAIVLFNAYIPEYIQANRLNHEVRRPRCLLLHRREVNKLLNGIQRKGMTLIPLDIHLTARGYAKLQIALSRGRKVYEKREIEKKRAWDREKARLLKSQF